MKSQMLAGLFILIAAVSLGTLGVFSFELIKEWLYYNNYSYSEFSLTKKNKNQWLDVPGFFNKKNTKRLYLYNLSFVNEEKSLNKIEGVTEVGPFTYDNFHRMATVKKVADHVTIDPSVVDYTYKNFSHQNPIYMPNICWLKRLKGLTEKEKYRFAFEVLYQLYQDSLDFPTYMALKSPSIIGNNNMIKLLSTNFKDERFRQLWNDVNFGLSYPDMLYKAYSDAISPHSFSINYINYFNLNQKEIGDLSNNFKGEFDSSMKKKKKEYMFSEDPKERFVEFWGRAAKTTDLPLFSAHIPHFYREKFLSFYNYCLYYIFRNLNPWYATDYNKNMLIEGMEANTDFSKRFLNYNILRKYPFVGGDKNRIFRINAAITVLCQKGCYLKD